MLEIFAIFFSSKMPKLHLTCSVNRLNDGCLTPAENCCGLAEEGIQPEPGRSDQKSPRLVGGFPEAL